MLDKILALASAISLKPSSPLEAVFYLTHGILLCSGFVGVVEQSNGIPGFEPSLREVPMRMFLPPTWSKTLSQSPNSNFLSFLYKLPSKPGKLLILKVEMQENEMVNIEFGPRNSEQEKQSFQLSLHELLASGAADSETSEKSLFGELEILNFELLDSHLLSGINHLFPDVDFLSHRAIVGTAPSSTITVTTTTTFNTNTAMNNININNTTVKTNISSTNNNKNYHTAALVGFAAPVRKGTPLAGFAPATPIVNTNTNTIGSNNTNPGFSANNKANYSNNRTINSSINDSTAVNPGPHNQYSSPYNVGRSDLDPFSNVVFPGGIGGGLLDGRGTDRNNVNNNTGNLVGPNHPMFFNDSNNTNDNSNNSNRFFPMNAFIPPSGAHLPVPRYDPTGPVFPRNEDIILGNVGNTNMRTRNGVHPLYEGEPNNDLEPIPGFGFHGDINEPNNMNNNLPVPPNSTNLPCRGGRNDMMNNNNNKK